MVVVVVVEVDTNLQTLITVQLELPQKNSYLQITS